MKFINVKGDEVRKILLLFLIIILITGICYTASITVASPVGGKIYKQGDILNISWNGSGLKNTVKITLWQNNTFVGVIIKNQPASGVYRWTVGNYLGGKPVSGSGFKIKIREQGGASLTTSGFSGIFTIAPIDYKEIKVSSQLTLRDGDKVSIIADNGKYLRNWKPLSWLFISPDLLPWKSLKTPITCERESRTFGIITGGTFKFKVEIVDVNNSKIRLKDDRGRYLKRYCCWKRHSYISASFAKEIYSVFIVESLGNNRVRLKADNGQYLKRFTHTGLMTASIIITSNRKDKYGIFSFKHIIKKRRKPEKPGEKYHKGK